MKIADKMKCKDNKNPRIFSNTFCLKKYVSGSLSVEAVLLMPIILMALFLILSFSFLTHQKVWFTAAAYEAALAPDGNLEKARLLLDEAPLTSDLPTPSVTQTSGYIQVSYSGTALTFLGDYKLTYKTTGKLELIRPTEHIRRMRLIQP